MRAFWETIERSAPFLAGHLSALTGWLDDADQPDHTGRPASDVAVARSCFEALASMDVPGCVERAGGELIGPVYMFLQSKSDREPKDRSSQPQRYRT